MRSTETFPPVEDLIPHRGSALLLRQVLEASERELTGLGQISSESPFADLGSVPGFVGLDLLAQAAAALDALRRRPADREARGEVGYLVGVREARFETATLPLAVPLVAHVRITGESASFATHEGSLRLGDVLCLRATLSTFRPASVPAATSR